MINRHFIDRKDGIIILMYHRVNDGVRKELSVKRKDFLWHMNYLKKNNYSVISMGEAYERIRNNDITGKHIVLTFDDGYRDFYRDAFPIIKDHGFPSILYIVPGYIEKDRT